MGFLSVKFSYKDLYARTVSENRMHCIDNFREEISIIVATLAIQSNYCRKTKHSNISNKDVIEAEKARAKLLTRLNMRTS